MRIPQIDTAMPSIGPARTKQASQQDRAERPRLIYRCLSSKRCRCSPCPLLTSRVQRSGRRSTLPAADSSEPPHVPVAMRLAHTVTCAARRWAAWTAVIVPLICYAFVLTNTLLSLHSPFEWRPFRLWPP